MAPPSSDTESIKRLIQHFFDTINAADTKALQATFLPEGNITIIRQDPPSNPPPISVNNIPSSTISNPKPPQTVTVVARLPIESFVKLLDDAERRRREQPPGHGHQPKLFEKPDLEKTEVEVEGLVGCAWSPFEVTFDGVMHHYGTMVFTVVKHLERGKGEVEGEGEGLEGWRVSGVSQSYRRTEGWD
ncbi:hypothetical protein LTS18_006143 [Coniosporium uncinatum]|uniref:Uncharacterized protein n=1 Tax=Coniosporium uncinatum TaxID=93489 RepID=A0ACC3D405_9PEZI|nr:hypothetical protein LTS18_006143 [Coniosporium uncinatum]